MAQRMRMNPLAVYLILECSTALFFSLIFTVNMIYQATVVNLSALQLVLMGTILEATIFCCEIPTGVLADVKSRRLSIIVGYVLIGLGFTLEGSLPFFWSVALAQVLWGLGYTFTSGATQAWVGDELGPEGAGRAFLRGAQLAQAGGLAAIPVSVALGRMDLALPIVLGGLCMIGLAAFLALAMTEEHFTPTPREERSTWGMMLKTARDARRAMRRQPLLLSLLGIGLFYGLYSEGFDRLWTPHLLQNFTFPLVGALEPVVWFGIIDAALRVISLGATELANRRVDTQAPIPMGRTLMLSAALVVAGLAGFALVSSFWVAVLLYWLVGALRSVTWPLLTAWFNLRIDDPQVRATLFSISSQVDAVGQIGGGPAVGAVGNVSLRAALVTSALLLSPVIPLYASAIRRSGQELQAEATL
jgi:DHA3 family tetracycline resistance protein-like MFS transporter